MDEFLTAELFTLIKNGFVVTLILMALFFLLRFPESWNIVVKEFLTKIIILSVALIYCWLVIESGLNNKQVIAYYLMTVAFSILFYEFAGKYIVRRWFKRYKGEDLKKVNQ